MIVPQIRSWSAFIAVSLLVSLLLYTLYVHLYGENSTLTANKQAELTQTRRDTASSNASQAPHHHQAPPCGQVCEVSEPDSIGSIRKDFNCTNILLRLKIPDGHTYNPPLKWAQIPVEKQIAFTRNGRMPMVREFYKNDVLNNSKGPVVFNKEDMQKFLTADPPKSTYGANGREMLTLLKNYTDLLKEKTGIVIGSASPWLEVMLLRLGVVKHVYTVDFQPVVFEHPQLSFLNMIDLADAFLQGSQERFDFAVSFSSIEHTGLGRYSDPLNPWGDMEAVAQVWCMLKPGGLFFLGLPSTKHEFGDLMFNAHRQYGEGLWRQLAANYEIVIWRYGQYLQKICVLKKPLAD